MYDVSVTTTNTSSFRVNLNARDILAKGTKWTVGNGKNISFWKDWWYGDGPLASIFPRPQTQEDVKVADMISEEGE